MVGHAEGVAAFAPLAGGRSLLDRSSTAELVADVLRERIIEGELRPGAQLSEQAVGAALGVSRNTLREAFRLLSHERLVVHELNRGVFVRALSREDVVDLYRVRRLLETAALDAAGQPDQNDLRRLRTAVEDGEQAAANGRESDVGTADLRFHQAIAALANSPRVDDLIRGLAAELRLAFHAMDNPGEFHLAYLKRNRAIVNLLDAGEVEQARSELAAYLDDAERQLLAVH